MLTQLPIVDRKTEFGTFRTLLDSSSDQSISTLLLKDDSGQGKTKLLKIYEKHCRDSKIPVTKIDLKGGSLSPIDILLTAQTDFRPIDFPRCKDITHKSFASPPTQPIQVEGNTTIGQASYSIQTIIQPGSLSVEEQRNWWETGAQAFLEDISEIGKSKQSRFVVLFDTYEQASLETKRWLVNHIVRMATPERIKSLVIVIAGKEVPTPTGEWEHCYHTINLGPLQLQDWLEYASIVIHEDIPIALIERVYSKFKHSPLEMANWINALAPQGDQSNVG